MGDRASASLGESTDITDVFEDNANLMDFLILLGPLHSHIGVAWDSHYSNNSDADW